MAHSKRFIPVIPVALFLLMSCAPVVVPTLRCSADAECGDGLVCTDGKCVTQPAGACRNDETRPCGPDPIGACRRGTQRCVAGAFETTCTGAVTPIAELCNAVDDNCDGTIDEGVLVTFFVDRDGDGFGSSAAGAESRQACAKPAGFAVSSTDCDDTNAAVNPSAREVCDPAGVDEDCSGSANDNCGCSNIGASQACCAGRGSQVCEARDGGAALSLCTVMASLEICNGIDDNCNGQTDELYSLNVDGGIAILSDGGVIQLDGGCSVGVGACARSAGSACISGSLACRAVAGSPGVEICNGIDDNCNGLTDEASPTLCAITGQACTLGICACPTGQSICGTSCQTVGGACSVGTGACSRQGSVLCTNGSATCDAVAGTPSAEICNNIDDNCNGQIDEASPTLCAVTGQSCTLGTCSCPTGQSVCGTSCQTLGGTCSAGVGACLRNGVIACISSGAACNATAGAPVAEVCDGVDNDCDGTIDNGVTITCYPDEDNDHYATVATPSQQCPAGVARIGFGSCPTGFVAPAASPGIDCAPFDSFAFVTVTTRADADGDLACTGSPITQCLGASLPFGQRLATNCSPTDDCDDTNASIFQLNYTRADADADTYCVGRQVQTCVGASAPAGRRLSSSCAFTDDCNDTSAALFRVLSVRTDADGDQYCVGATTSQCTGNAPLAGTRLANQCLGDDCRDSNALATVSCFLPGAYTTTSATKQCGFGFAPSENKTVTGGVPACPPGFSRFNAAYQLSYTGNAGGACTVTSDTTLTMSCASLTFGTFMCSIQGDCAAN